MEFSEIKNQRELKKFIQTTEDFSYLSITSLSLILSLGLERHRDKKVSIFRISYIVKVPEEKIELILKLAKSFKKPSLDDYLLELLSFIPVLRSPLLFQEQIREKYSEENFVKIFNLPSCIILKN